jgi:antitoxin YefM
METFYLLKSPENARRLIKAVEEHQAGKGNERKLIES